MIKTKKVGILMVLAMIFAILFGACGDAGGDAGGDLGEPDEVPNYPAGEGPGYYKVGEKGPGGGVIIYYDPDGFEVEGYGKANYLQAAPEDSIYDGGWGAHGTLISGITTFTSDTDPLASKIGNGWKDTQLIVAHMNANGISSTAAQVCAAANFGGLNDWFLPSAGELNQLCLNRALVENMEEPFYWSSSQYHENSAWIQHFDGSKVQAYDGKSYSNPVRAIRAF